MASTGAKSFMNTFCMIHEKGNQEHCKVSQVGVQCGSMNMSIG